VTRERGLCKDRVHASKVHTHKEFFRGRGELRGELLSGIGVRWEDGPDGVDDHSVCGEVALIHGEWT